MKTKAKLLLAISTLSAVVLAAGVTSTFAWFTTKNEAKFTTGTLKVDTLSSITVSVKDIGYNEEAAFSPASNNVIGEDKALGIVSSGDGQNFFAPAELSDDADDYTEMAAVGTKSTWSGTNKYVGYIRYIIHVAADPETTSHDLAVFFDASGIADADLASCVKVAFYKANSDGSLATGAAVTIYSDDGANFKPWVSTTERAEDPEISTSAFSGIDAADEAVTLVEGFTNDTATAVADYVLALWVEGTEEKADNDLFGKTATFGAHFLLV